jgi:integrase
VRLGAFDEITVDQARDKCAGLVGDIQMRGANPMADRRAVREETTLGELWTMFEQHAKSRKRSFAADLSRWTNHLAAWSSRRLSEITMADVAALHSRIGQKQPLTANRVLALLSVMFKRVARQRGFTGPNPCEGVQRFHEESRERFLNADELSRFAKAVKAETPLYADLFNLCLWTGQRQGNVRSMRWDELDLSTGRWSIPASKFKTGKALVVHLAAQAIAILKRRKKVAADQVEWVFPQTDNAARHITNPVKAWRRVCKAAGLADVRIHDLRRTNGSWQAAAGASLHIIGKSLGQSTQQTTATYARLQIDPIRASVNKATAAMAAAMGKKR